MPAARFRRFTTICCQILAAGFVFSASPAYALANPLVEELVKFSSRENGKGNLLNPPLGNVSADVVKNRDLVQEIIGKFSLDKRLAEKGHIVIHVYGNPVMNAWVHQLNPAHKFALERKWKKQHPGEIWPLRKAWGFPDDGKPIYEIGVTTELLRQLKTKGELAFALGHELTHLLEGHTDPVRSSTSQSDEDEGQDDDEIDDDDEVDEREESAYQRKQKEIFEKWWSKQANEGVADNSSIDFMLGHFELSAAISLMEKLFPIEKSPLGLTAIVLSGQADHHAEGVRISMLQIYIEYLRRTNAKAKPIRDELLPPFTKLNTYGRTENPLGTDLESFKAFYERIDQYRKFRGLMGSDRCRSTADLIRKALERINSSSASKVTKVNAFLQALITITHVWNDGYPLFSHSDVDFFKGLDDQVRYQIETFLVKNASGEGAWSLADFQSLLAIQQPKARFHLDRLFIGTKFGQKIVNNIRRSSPVWNQWWMYMSTMASFKDSQGAINVGTVSTTLKILEKNVSPASRLVDEFRSNLLAHLQSADSEELMAAQANKDKPGLPAFSAFPRFFTSDEFLKKQVHDATQPHEKAFQRTLARNLLDTLKNKNKLDDLHQEQVVMDLIEHISLPNLDPSERETLLQAYAEFVQQKMTSLNDGGYGYVGQLYKETFEFHIYLLERFSTNREKFRQIFQFLLVSINEGYLPSPEALSPSAAESLKRIVRSLTKEEIWQISESLTPIEIETRNGISMVGLGDRDTREYTRESTTFRKVINGNFLELLEKYSDGPSHLQSFSVQDLKRLLNTFVTARYFESFNRGSLAKKFKISRQAGKALLLSFHRLSSNFKDWPDTVRTFERIMSVGEGWTLVPLPIQAEIRELFQRKIESMRPREKFQWLRRPSVRKILDARFVGHQLALYVSASAGKDRKRLAAEVERVEKILNLQQEWWDAYETFRNDLCELQNVQPQEFKQLFKDDPRSNTEKANSNPGVIRAASAFTTYTRSLDFADQLHMIEFLMGRTDQLPQSVTKVGYGLVEQLGIMREEMKYRTVLERAMAVNSIFTGPNAMLRKPEGKKIIFDRLLEPVSSTNHEFARTLLRGLDAAEKENFSLILSYALAQKSEGGKLTEAHILKCLLDAYGVPGVKLAQYLGFTEEFEQFQATLETYQDAAMPISHYQALVLVQKRLGNRWDPTTYKIVSIKGSGSVNIALRVLNITTGVHEILNIARDEIEVKNQEDFRRIRLLIRELTSTPELKAKFGFILGLMDIIEKSVTLEFDKAHAFAMQKRVQNLYRRKIGEWTYQTVDAYSLDAEGMSIYMEEAPGVGARHVRKTNPAAYNSAMRGLMQIDYEILRGVSEDGIWTPMPLVANPDIHDGQVLIKIDDGKKLVTILDFGQAVEISNLEREFGIDLLRIISKRESPEAAIALVQRYSRLIQHKSIPLTKADIARVYLRKERMDIFVHLVSTLAQAGFEIPLATVHWILETNRTIKLGSKIGISPEASIRWLVGMRKLGIPLTAINGVQACTDGLKQMARRREIK